MNPIDLPVLVVIVVSAVAMLVGVAAGWYARRQ